MKWYQQFAQSILAAFERAGRARALAVLRTMNPRFLREFGISAELLEQRESAWPWRVKAGQENAVIDSATGGPILEPWLVKGSNADLTEFLTNQHLDQERDEAGKRGRIDQFAA